MSGITTYLLNEILNYNFGLQAYTVPSTLYFGLSSTVVTASGYTSVTEPAVGSYARVSFTNNKTNWSTCSVPATGLYNNVAVSFPKSTASWGVMLSLFIIDSSSGTGNILWFKTLDPAIIIQNKTTTSFESGEIIITLPDSTGTTVALNDILNYNFGKQAYSVSIPSTMYFGLSTTEVTATGYGSVTESSGYGYARTSLSNDTSGWTTSSAGTLSNKLAVTFPQCSGGNWGTILSIFIIDSTSGVGNVFWFYTLSPTIVTVTNMVVSFAVGAIAETLS
jgi:hypothetical protein